MKIAAFLTVAVVGAGSAMAAQTYFTSRAAFNAATGGGLAFESFEGPERTGGSVTYGGLTFTESNGLNFITHTRVNNFFTSATTDGDHSIWFDDNDFSVATLTFSSGPIFAVGLDIAISSPDGTMLIGGDANDSLSLASFQPRFWGVISTTPITSITFAAAEGPEVGFDAVSYGVPAPGAAAMLGLAGLAAARRRRA